MAYRLCCEAKEKTDADGQLDTGEKQFSFVDGGEKTASISPHLGSQLLL